MVMLEKLKFFIMCKMKINIVLLFLFVNFKKDLELGFDLGSFYKSFTRCSCEDLNLTGEEVSTLPEIFKGWLDMDLESVRVEISKANPKIIEFILRRYLLLGEYAVFNSPRRTGESVKKTLQSLINFKLIKIDEDKDEKLQHELLEIEIYKIFIPISHGILKREREVMNKMYEYL